MSDPRRDRRALALCLALLVLSVAVPAAARSPEVAVPTTTFRGPAGELQYAGRRIERPPAVVPLDHWSYPVLGRLVTRGVIDLDLTTLPVSRREILDAVRSADGACELTPRERWLLERLELEFEHAAVDAPAAYLKEGGAQVGLGLVVSVRGSYVGSEEPEIPSVTPTIENYAPARGDTIVPAAGDTIALPTLDDDFGVDATVHYEVWGGVGDGIGFFTDANVVFHGQQDERIEDVTTRARAWRGMTADIRHGYLMVEREHWRVVAGRSGAAWGRSERGRLLLSGSAPTLDGVEARAVVGPLRFVTLHAVLDYEEIGTEVDLGDDDRVFLAAHRLEVGNRTLKVGLNEAVVYSRAIPDPVYLNPFAPYYVSQHNERADDNILWSLDVDWRPSPGHELYTELLADDLQYDRDTSNPDKYAATFGYRYAGVLFDRTDVEVTAEYSHARKWTYTHKWVEHRCEHDGLPLGFDLGPDADRFLVEAVAHPRRHLAVGVRYERSRKGEGSLRLPYVKGTDDPDTEFPSGDARTVDVIGLTFEYDDLDGFTAGASVGYYRADGGDPVDESIWEVTGHVGFRI